MSRGPEAVVRAVYAALSREDVDVALGLCAEDAVFDWSRSLGPFAGVYHGREGVRGLWCEVLAAVEEMEFAVEEAVERGDDVLVMVRATMRGRGSGAPVVARGPHLWTVVDGRVSRFRLFQERTEAEAAMAADGAPAGS